MNAGDQDTAGTRHQGSTIGWGGWPIVTAASRPRVSHVCPSHRSLPVPPVSAPSLSTTNEAAATEAQPPTNVLWYSFAIAALPHSHLCLYLARIHCSLRCWSASGVGLVQLLGTYRS